MCEKVQNHRQNVAKTRWILRNFSDFRGDLSMNLIKNRMNVTLPLKYMAIYVQE